MTGLNIILCADDDLLSINKQYLNHDYYTDIITFQYEKNPIEAELYISLDRVKDNALQIPVSWNRELLRVIIHGVLHCCGYKDKTTEDKTIMRKKENEYLGLLNQDIPYFSLDERSQDHIESSL